MSTTGKTFQTTAKLILLFFFALGIAPSVIAAEEVLETTKADTNDEEERAEEGLTLESLNKSIAVGNAKSERAANIAWMMTSSALVLFMTAPGLAMFYSGLVRRKNVLSVMMQCIFLMGIMTVVWALWGYSLAFGGKEGTSLVQFIGNGDHIMMNGLTMTDGVLGGESIPDLLFMVFQGMFFIITPALICGAFAERMKFSAMVAFSVLWGTLIYCPLCHMVWHENGWLFHGAKNTPLYGGAIDFAGGTVVHISSGVSALIIALVIGKRTGFGKSDLRPHNLTYTAMGGTMLWVGWFGFNAGSAGAANDLAVNAFVVTHFSAAAGCVAWAVIEWLVHGKPSILGAISGAVAGLVCITPASGAVQPWAALIIGLAGGVVCYIGCGIVKRKFGYDDSLDAFGIHGIGGILGAILTGVFASKHVDGVSGLIENPSTGGPLMVGQIAAVLVTIAMSVVGTLVLIKLIDIVIGIRVTAENEVRGLDYSEHAEEGYIL